MRNAHRSYTGNLDGIGFVWTAIDTRAGFIGNVVTAYGFGSFTSRAEFAAALRAARTRGRVRRTIGDWARRR